MSEYSESVTVASNYIQTVFGQFDANIKKIEKEYSVSMILRDDKLKVSGSEEGVKKSIQVIEQLFQMADRGSSIDEQKVDYTISIVNEHPQEAKESLAELDRDIICHTMSGKPIKPKTVGQRTYVNSIEKSMIVFGVGPAGTGKTYLAMAKAITAFKNNEVGRIILTRPAIEAGEKLGFLPGDLQSKVDPYLRPLYDALYEIMGADAFMKNMEKGLIEVAPLAYMRGRTLDNAYIVLDEAQNTTPAQMKAVFDNMKGEKKNHFTVGINDDVTHLSLPVGENIVTAGKSIISCKFWGLGSDGTVGANKNSIKIIGDHTDQYAQAYFEYDSKKSGGVTKSHLRFGHEPIHSTYYVTMADFVACHKTSYIKDFDIVSEIKPHGTFLLNTSWTGAELEEHLPNRVKRQIAEREINFYTIDATAIAMELGLGNRTNTVLQAAFFKLSGIIPIEDAVKYMKAAIVKSYSKKGQKIVDMNSAAVDRGVDAAVKINVPESWKTLADDTKAPDASLPHYIREIQIPVNKQAGDAIPVSEFMPYADGVTPSETSKYEKRGIAVKVPQWIPENCIGCNKCALVCPHAAIRPFLLNAEEEAAKPAAFVTKEAKGKGFEGLTFRMQVDPLDCQGCGACANVCPAKEKALVMELLDTQMPEQENWEHALTLSTKTNPMDKFTVRGSQFERPLYEFSGACAGCGEAPYMKLMSQLFGDRMFVTSATGCAYVVGSSTPSFPYVANEKGHGPANSNSLFEDNAEYALGMKLSIDQMRRQMAAHAEAVVASTSDAALKSALEAWLAEGDNGDKTRALSEAVVAALNATAETSDDIAFLKANKDALPKKSVWMYGGDGWAYDIGFGGLDHVLASGADVNVLVVDTEVYSNTGGQASKATQLGAVAQFANGGKRTGKKDLGAIAMTYGNVYVAQVAMGANEQHLITALKEAEAHHGPSILIAYAPCINHGISKGMSQAQLEEKLASECGYWPLWRYVPELKAEGKNPFILTSKEPNGQLLDFMMGETRFASLTRTFPETAKVLFAEAEEFCAQRYAKYKKLAEQ